MMCNSDNFLEYSKHSVLAHNLAFYDKVNQLKQIWLYVQFDFYYSTNAS